MFGDNLKVPSLSNWLCSNLTREASVMQYLRNKAILCEFPMDIPIINLFILKPSQAIKLRQEVGSSRTELTQHYWLEIIAH